MIGTSPFELTCAGLSDIGRVRAQNEDRWLVDLPLGLFVVADGIGGAAAGDCAAEIVVESLPQLMNCHLSGSADLASPESSSIVRHLLVGLSERLRIESQARFGLQGMGSTVVLMLIRGADALIGNLGDSRAYLLRHETLEQLTRDHSLIQLLLDHNEITQSEVSGHPSRGLLTRYIGMEGEAVPDVRTLRLSPDDRLLLCSDGLTGMLTDDELSTILKQRFAPDVVCSDLMAAANQSGGNDNITAIVVDVSTQ